MSHGALVLEDCVAAPETAYGNGFCIGGVAVEITGHRRDDVILASPLDRFRVETDAPDIRIQVEWCTGLSTSGARPLFDSGCTWRLYEGEAGLQFDFHVPTLGAQPYKRLFTDCHFSTATLQMNEKSFAHRAGTGLSALTYPLDELLISHRLTQEKAIELHACGIVTADGTGNLFVGHSGAGKSTTTRLWTTTHEEVEVLSDDRIIVRERAGGTFMYGTPWHGEAAFASPARAPVTRICILEHGRGNVLTRLSQSQAVAELFARSFVPFHRHEYVDSALQFLQDVVGRVPCYRYAFEPNARAVDTILNVHDEQRG